MAYCTVEEVRAISNIQEADIATATLSGIIDEACKFLNIHLAVEVEDEPLDLLDGDDTNTIFYTTNYPIADTNSDLTVTITDVTVYDDLYRQNPTELTVSSIEGATGKITMASSQTEVIYCNYSYLPYAIDSSRMRFAAIIVSAKMAWDYIIKDIDEFKIGDISKKRKNPFATQMTSILLQMKTNIFKAVPYGKRLFTGD